VGELLDMYILEITTNDSRETLLKRETAETWKEINDMIDDMQDLAFDNIKIDIYKQTEENDPEYLGDFTNIKRGRLLDTTKTKKKNDSLIVGLAALTMFPIMVINRLVKK
jgi:hypothetical protein